MKLNTAPGTAAIGLKCNAANDTAKPEFCIPTSILTAFDLVDLILKDELTNIQSYTLIRYVK